MNNVLTASRMTGFLRCSRQHFWGYEIGLRKQAVGVALRFGSAWARAMEARWAGATYMEALAVAIPEGVDLDAYTCSTIAALLAGYYEYYGEVEDAGKIHPEVQIPALELVEGFTIEGKIDGLGSMRTGESVIIEAKTTGDSLAPDSQFWLRLAFNMQIYQYVERARKLGWDVGKVFYDVTRKPSIKPKRVEDLDEQGRKIVLDADDKRVFIEPKAKKPKKSAKGEVASATEQTKPREPRQSGSKENGWVVKSHVESPDEFCDRLYADTLARPSFYFARREIAVLDDQLREFELQRFAIARGIVAMRANEFNASKTPYRTLQRDPSAWPRNVSKDTCGFCPYKDFCLQNISVDPNQPPQGFEIQSFNPELDYAQPDDTTAEPV